MAEWCEKLYREKSGELILYGRALGLCHGESEDVLHEVFLALLKLEYCPDQPVHYCLRAYRNRALNYRASLWRRLTRELESKRWFDRAAEEDRVEEVFLVKAMEGLPPAQREVIVLKIWHRHTFEEIGALLDESPNTVAGRYRYGLNKLRDTLKSNLYERLELPGESFEFVDAPVTVVPGR